MTNVKLSKMSHFQHHSPPATFIILCKLQLRDSSYQGQLQLLSAVVSCASDPCSTIRVYKFEKLEFLRPMTKYVLAHQAMDLPCGVLLLLLVLLVMVSYQSSLRSMWSHLYGGLISSSSLCTCRGFYFLFLF